MAFGVCKFWELKNLKTSPSFLNMRKRLNEVWVFSGGANQTAYICGAGLAREELKIPLPDLIVTGSGGAANAYFQVACQTKLSSEIYGGRLSTKKILNLLRFWRVFDCNCMVDNVFMDPEHPLDLNKIRESKTEILVGVTNRKTGKAEFFSTKDRGIDLIHLLKATMMVPVLSGPFRDYSIPLNGGRYFDTRASSRPEFLIEKADSFNPEKILVFGIKPNHKYRYGADFWYHLWLSGKHEEFVANQMEYMRKQKEFRNPLEAKVVYLGPEEKLEMPPWANSKESLSQAVKRGYEETMQKKELLSR